MATGGDSVDSGRKNICNICEEGDVSVTAEYFCVSCEQYLCLGCKQYHSRVKATKSHQVIGTDEIPSNFVLLIVPSRYFCGGSFCFMSWCLEKMFVLLTPYVCFLIFS